MATLTIIWPMRTPEIDPMWVRCLGRPGHLLVCMDVWDALSDALAAAFPGARVLVGPTDRAYGELLQVEPADPVVRRQVREIGEAAIRDILRCRHTFATCPATRNPQFSTPHGEDTSNGRRPPSPCRCH